MSNDVYIVLGNEIQHQLKTLEKYTPENLSVRIETIIDERENKQVTYWSNFIIDIVGDDETYFDTENNNEWKEDFITYFNIKDENSEEVHTILSNLEKEFDFTNGADAHSTDGHIEISNNRIFIKLGIDGEKPIDIIHNKNKLTL